MENFQEIVEAVCNELIQTTKTNYEAQQVPKPVEPVSNGNPQKRKKSAKNQGSKPPKKKRLKNPIPLVKIMTFEDVNHQKKYISADAFNYREHPDIKFYFLSHYHSDHFYGITKSWNNGIIVCSEITGNLLESQIKIPRHLIRTVKFETTVELLENVFVTFLDANHCPGAAIALFEHVTSDNPEARKLYGLEQENLFNEERSLNNSKYIRACENGGLKVLRTLHTGDFRVSRNMIAHRLLQNHRIDHLYLDTTYLDPRYSFPEQDLVVSQFGQFAQDLLTGTFYENLKESLGPLSKMMLFQQRITDFFGARFSTKPVEEDKTFKNDYLFCIGTYTIGKEKVAIELAKRLGMKVYANVAKRKVFSCFVDHPMCDLITDDPYSTNIHLVPMRQLMVQSLEAYFQPYKSRFKNVIGVRPTGWSLRAKPSFSAKELRTLAPHEILEKTIQDSNSRFFDGRYFVNQFNSNRILQIYEIPYSEHSSFRELCMFTLLLDIGRIIPTVNLDNPDNVKRMYEWLNLCKKFKEKRQYTIEDF